MWEMEMQCLLLSKVRRLRSVRQHVWPQPQQQDCGGGTGIVLEAL